MSSPLLYQWEQKISQIFPQLGQWQAWTLAFFSYGVILAESCRLNSIARALTGRAEASSLERRLQRWLANDHIVLSGLVAQKPYENSCWVEWRCKPNQLANRKKPSVSQNQGLYQ